MFKISNKLSDENRHYINNLIISGRGGVRDENGKLPKNITHELIVEDGFIVDANRVIIVKKAIKNQTTPNTN